MSANKVFWIIALILVAMIGVSVWTTYDLKTDKAFAEEMARANSEVSQAQADAIAAQARAIEVQAETNQMLERAQLARERAERLEKTILIIMIIIEVPLLLVLTAVTVYIWAKQRREAVANGN
jgi:multidrug efflux pump subunit AcrA (membrane-fusion protein)